jgi:hypothetical protein
MATPLHIVWSRSTRTNDTIEAVDLDERIRKVLELGQCDPYTVHQALKSSMRQERSNSDPKVDHPHGAA